MKFNYTTYFIVVIGGFMVFILFFVYKIQTDKNYDHELVLEDYYTNELKFNKQLMYIANTDIDAISVFKTKENLTIEINDITKPIKDSIIISFYRPNDKTKDREIALASNQSRIQIPLNQFDSGRWDIKVHWMTKMGENIQYFKLNI